MASKWYALQVIVRVPEDWPDEERESAEDRVMEIFGHDGPECKDGACPVESLASSVVDDPDSAWAWFVPDTVAGSESSLGQDDASSIAPSDG